MPDRPDVSDSDVFYYRGRFWAVAAWPTAIFRQRVETAAPPVKRPHCKTNRSRSARTTAGASEHIADQDDEKTPVTTEEQVLNY